MPFYHQQLQETLSDYYLGDFVVHRSVLDAAMTLRPDLAAEALDYGWGDTVVREALIDAVAGVLGFTWPSYGDAVLVEGAYARFVEAHARYVAEKK